MAELGTNIRNLREAFGETQLELAHSLGFESPATISMYESGARGQNSYEVISKIAYHYRVTKEQLAGGGFSSWDLKSIPLEDPAFTGKVLHFLLPFFGPDKERTDDGSREAFDRYTVWLVLNGGRHPVGKDEILSCLEACDASASPAACSGSVQMLLYYGLGEVYGDIRDGLWKLQDGELTRDRFFKWYYLRDISPEEEARSLRQKEKKRLYFEEFGVRLRNTIRSLYAVNGWWMVAEYYAALQYLFGLIDGDRSGEELFRIGQEMMRSLMALGNPYAGGYRKLLEQFHIV